MNRQTFQKIQVKQVTGLSLCVSRGKQDFQSLISTIVVRLKNAEDIIRASDWRSCAKAKWQNVLSVW